MRRLFNVLVFGSFVVEQVRWMLRPHRGDMDEDEEEGLGTTSCKQRPARFDLPHPRDPRLRDDCMFCLDPLKRDVLSTRLAVLEDGSIALGVYEETLLRPCDRCGYALHACCALACLARSRDCIVCKRPLL